LNALQSVKRDDPEVYRKLTEQHIDDFKLLGVTYVNSLQFENKGELDGSTRVTTVRTTVGSSSTETIKTSSVIKLSASASGTFFNITGSITTSYDYNFSETLTYATSEEHVTEEVITLDLS
jgi:hypothetical protein